MCVHKLPQSNDRTCTVARRRSHGVALDSGVMPLRPPGGRSWRPGHGATASGAHTETPASIHVRLPARTGTQCWSPAQPNTAAIRCRSFTMMRVMDAQLENAAWRVKVACGLAGLPTHGESAAVRASSAHRCILYATRHVGLDSVTSEHCIPHRHTHQGPAASMGLVSSASSRTLSRSCAIAAVSSAAFTSASRSASSCVLKVPTGSRPPPPGPVRGAVEASPPAASGITFNFGAGTGN
jgi:hypothetical protein